MRCIYLSPLPHVAVEAGLTELHLNMEGTNLNYVYIILIESAIRNNLISLLILRPSNTFGLALL
jgi:hypothetical protein